MLDAQTTAKTARFAQYRHLLAAGGLAILATLVRLPGVERPLLGTFATKNVVYAMIARNWARHAAPLWYPTLDCLVGGEPSLHMLEFPASAYLTGLFWRIFGGSLDTWGRATAVGFSAASVAIMFLLVDRWHGRAAAWGAALALALAPVSILYGQSFMLEASLVFFTLATFDSLDRWQRTESSRWLAVAALAYALVLLTKIYMLVLLLPLAAMVFWQRNGRRPWTRGRCLLAGLAVVAAVTPGAVWSIHAYQTAAPGNPLATHVFYSVRQSAAEHLPPHPLLFSPDFYRQVLDDLAGVALTPVGLALALAGMLNRGWRRHAAWLASMAILVVLLPRKFHEMNYYYLAVLPPLCILVGLGWQVLYERLRPSRLAIAGLVAVAAIFSFRYAAVPAFITPPEDRPVLAAAEAARHWTTPDEPIVTMHGSTIDLLYYCDRRGWAFAPDEPNLAQRLADCRRQGARIVVVVGSGDTAPTLEGRVLRTVERGEGFVVYLVPEVQLVP
ncbi:MAG: ArnT family glycosyltransferase [Pirellulales bacterium]